MKSTTLKDRSGLRYGRLFVIQREANLGPHIAWLCRCDCGATTVVRGMQLQSGHTTSCGCRKREVMAQLGDVGRKNRTHGCTNTPEFRCWSSMHTRCDNPHSQGYARYGGRGITICEQWRSFESFLADMGPRPTMHHSIDRIDVNGNYEPRNCRWATPTEQSRNQRTNRVFTINGRSQSVAAWAEEVGMKADTVRHRLDRGLSLREALSQAVHVGGRR